ncbi:MAG TPA: hypothetical protein VNL15_01515 [Dehalococcoidia bacterium]|nr:hypothetical protein [Dehalococcoidia bacterium]
MLTAFGAAAVSFMFITYWLEHRSRWFVAAFALGCAASSAYAWLAEAYPFFVVEALWAVVALRRFILRSRAEPVRSPSAHSS